MNWQDERWVKLYTRDSGDWLFLSFDAQALFLMLLRKVDRAGYLPLGRKGVDAVPVLLGHAGAADRISAALKVLLDDGCVRLCGEALFVPNFGEAQEATTSQEERKRRFNELHGAKNATERNGTQKNALELTEEREEIEQRDKRKAGARATASLPPATPLQAFISSEWGIRNAAEYEKRMAEAFPSLDLLAEAKKARGYQKANPQKHYKNHGRYFFGWLGNAKRFASESQPDVAETERAGARAAREIAETKRRNAELDAVKAVPPPANFRELMGKIGNGK